jgi:hypothetical protein
MAGASTNNNIIGKAAATDISNTAPSKEDSVLNPSTVAPNTANMPPSINVSDANKPSQTFLPLPFPAPFSQQP